MQHQGASYLISVSTSACLWFWFNCCIFFFFFGFGTVWITSNGAQNKIDQCDLLASLLDITCIRIRASTPIIKDRLSLCVKAFLLITHRKSGKLIAGEIRNVAVSLACFASDLDLWKYYSIGTEVKSRLRACPQAQPHPTCIFCASSSINLDSFLCLVLMRCPNSF
jgi:hypothetical protein